MACVALFMAICPTVLRAQCSNSTQGKDFWFMFLNNYAESASDLTIVVTAANTVMEDGSTVYVQVHITNPNDTWGKIVQVPLGGSKVVEIPVKKAVSNKYNTVTECGFHVVSNVDVSVYASNFQDATFDIATIYPTTTLDTEYVVQTYPGLSGYGTEVGFIATEDYTEVKAVLSCSLSSGSYKAGDTLTVSLNEGETFLMKAAEGKDLSGTRIFSNGRPIGVFQGTICANVPSSCTACDHLYEQTLPLKMWDQKYVIVPIAEHVKDDRAIVTSAYDDCVVTYDGEELCTLDAGESKEFTVTNSKTHLLEATEPVTVCLYIAGGTCNNVIGDPAAVIIPPASQGLPKVRFQAIGTERTNYHYINLVVPTEAKDSMRIDDELLTGTFSDLDCGYSTMQLSVDTGTHTLSNRAGKFVAYFYGMGEYESYAYIAGMSLRNLRNRIYVNGVDMTDDTSAYIACYGTPVELKVNIDDFKKPGTWYVDSQYVYYIDTAIMYDFESPGLHRVDAVAPNGCDTVTAYVYCRAPADTVPVELCYGDQYKVDTLSFSTTGYHTYAVKDSYGCDSMITIDLKIIDSSFTLLVDTACEGRPYTWRGKQIDTPGYYADTLTSSHGCDSVVALDLTVLKIPATPFTYLSHCADGSYTLTVDLSNAVFNGVVPPAHWTSDPPDPMLEGQEEQTSVNVLPLTYTLYKINVDYRCPFVKSIGLNVVDVPQADMKVQPAYLDYDHPSFDAYDNSKNAGQRQWWVDNQLMTEQSSALHYEVDVQHADSVQLMLVASDGTCYDTATHTLMVWHTGVYAPNIFMPNDYAAPRFVVQVHDVELKSLAIYNRSGQRLYYSEEDPEQGWDGTYEGKPCPQGAYVWMATYTRNDTPTRMHSVTGLVTLVR